jgi:hypothetical protein
VIFVAAVSAWDASAVGDDYFFVSPPGQSAPPPVAPAQTPQAGPMPGMPGYSWQQSQQVQGQVLADAGPAVPMSSGNLVAGAAALGSLLMLIGSWGPWIKIGIFHFNETVGGLRSGLNGRYVLALGIAALLTAGAAMTSGQTSREVRQICAGVLGALGAIGLGLVIHDWTTISDHARQVNGYADLIRSQAASQFGASPAAQSLLASFDGIHVARAWGLILSGAASTLTGLAGVYLFLVKQP